MNEQAIVWASLLCVVVSCWFMWRLIKESGPIVPWILFSIMCLLVISRRLLTLAVQLGYTELRFTNEVLLPSLLSIAILATAVSLYYVFGNGSKRL